MHVVYYLLGFIVGIVSSKFEPVSIGAVMTIIVGSTLLVAIHEVIKWGKK